MTIADYCATCNHHRRFHGDRAIGGCCTHGVYPLVCDCNYWKGS